MIARGTILARRVGDTPKNEAERFIGCPVCGGWIDAVISGKSSSTTGPYPHRSRINPNDGCSVRNSNRRLAAQLRDRKNYAMEAAPLIKSKNPQSMVEVNDLQSGGSNRTIGRSRA
jgi:hypothetical protein